MKFFLTRSISAVFAIFDVASCQGQIQEEPEMGKPDPMVSSDGAAALASTIDTLEELWNTGNYDRLDTILAANFRRQAPDENRDRIATCLKGMTPSGFA